MINHYVEPLNLPIKTKLCLTIMFNLYIYPLDLTIKSILCLAKV